MKKLIKFIRKIKRNRLYSEKNRIEKRLTELNIAIFKIDCDNQEELLIEKREVFFQKILEQLTLRNSNGDFAYTQNEIDYYKEEIEEARNGNIDSYHLLRNNFQYNDGFKKETGAFKNA